MSQLRALLRSGANSSSFTNRMLEISGLKTIQWFPVRGWSIDTYNNPWTFDDKQLLVPTQIQVPSSDVTLTYHLVQNSSPSTTKNIEILSLELQTPDGKYELVFPRNRYGKREITINKDGNMIGLITLAKEYENSGIWDTKNIGDDDADKREIKEEIQWSYGITVKYRMDDMFTIMAGDEASYKEITKVIESLYNIYFTNSLPSAASSIASIL